MLYIFITIKLFITAAHICLTSRVEFCQILVLWLLWLLWLLLLIAVVTPNSPLQIFVI